MATSFYPMRLLILWLLILGFSMGARGNGAVWDPGLTTKPPGPRGDTPLILDRENVIFQPDGVHATFWIKNPTNKELTVLMGFPVPTNSFESASDAGHYFYDNDGQLLFKVEVEGKTVPVRLRSDWSTPTYPLVFGWTMTFPPGTTIRYSAHYPLTPEWRSEDETGGAYRLSYITHTGGFFAKPIRRADFEIRIPRLTKALSRMKEGTFWEEGGAFQLKIHRKIEPQPFHFDPSRNLLRFSRRNWTPSQGKDDIQVALSYSRLCPLRGVPFEGGCPCPSPEAIQRSRVSLDGGKGSYAPFPNSFASEIHLEKAVMNDQWLKQTMTRAKEGLFCLKKTDPNPKDNNLCPPLYLWPSHLRAELEILVVQYLLDATKSLAPKGQIVEENLKFLERQLVKAINHQKNAKRSLLKKSLPHGTTALPTGHLR